MAIATAGVRSFPRENPAESISQALREVEKAGCRALYGPEFGEARIKDPNNSELRRWHQVLTGFYFGRTNRGTEVVIGVNRPHYLSSPDNIEAAINHGLIDGAAATPEVASEIKRLLDLEGDGVAVEDYKDWKKAKSGIMPLKDALNHPVLKLILGGRARVEEYVMDYHSRAFNAEKIEVFKRDDLGNTPVARLGLFGNDFGDDFIAGNNIYGIGRFAGVSQLVGAEGAATKKTESPLEDLVGKGTQGPGSNIYVIPGPFIIAEKQSS